MNPKPADGHCCSDVSSRFAEVVLKGQGSAWERMTRVLMFGFLSCADLRPSRAPSLTSTVVVHTLVSVCEVLDVGSRMHSLHGSDRW